MNDFAPITVSRTSTTEEREMALTRIYYQVLERMPYAWERKQLAKEEKDFLKDKIGVRRFLKLLGCSSLYLDSFYYSSSNAKFLENCFKHFLGRAIANHDEMRYYGHILLTQGVHRVITEILDSEEYRKAFGCFTVPYARELNYYESPKAYLESRMVNEEHIGQRGWAMPTLYWHGMGYVCENGTCHPEAYEILEPLQPAIPVHPEMNEAVDAIALNPADRSVEELLELLRTATPAEAREVVAALSPQQRQVLRKAIH